MFNARKTLALSCLLIALGSALPTEASVGKYRLEKFLPAGAKGATVTGLNEKGDVVGRYLNANNVWVPYAYRGGVVQDLAYPNSLWDVTPTDINSQGRVVGYGTRTSPSGAIVQTALMWNLATNATANPVQVYSFGNLNNGYSRFNSIGDSQGNPVGAANGRDFYGTSTMVSQPMGFDPETNVQMGYPNLANRAGMGGEILNAGNNGVMVGWTLTLQGTSVAATWTNGVIKGISAPAEATGSVRAVSNSSAGVVGDYMVSPSQAKAWFAGISMAPIPRLSGSLATDSNFATGINTSGHVVGTCEIGNANFHGFIWDQQQVFSLAGLVQGLRPGNTIPSVADINDRGEIAVTVRQNAVDSPALLKPLQTITCALTLEDFVGSPAGEVLQWAAFNVAGDQVLDQGLTLINSQGLATIETIVQGSADVVIKTSHWLSRRVRVNLGTFGSASYTSSLINGDVDGDNSISIFDYIDLSIAFDKNKGEAGFNPYADLDGDETVSVFDYIILSNNFDLSGE